MQDKSFSKIKGCNYKPLNPSSNRGHASFSYEKVPTSQLHITKYVVQHCEKNITLLRIKSNVIWGFGAQDAI